MMKKIKKLDLHMHSTVSDGTDTPEALLDQVRRAGLDLFALTDHDAIKGYGRLRAIRKADDPLLLSGVEFSCKDELGKYHILGYGYDPDTAPIQQVVELGHQYRMQKVRARLSFIEEKFGFTFPPEQTEALLAMDNPGKPHIGNLMVKYGYAPTKEVAIHDYINQAHFPTAYVRPEEAIRGILGSGGIPVLAHPAYGSGEELIVGAEMDARLKRLIGFGLQGVEAFYSGFTPKLRDQTLYFARKYRLFVTAGSDYHGKNKIVELGDIGLDILDWVPWSLRRFIEAIEERL